jgi:hypothetical protein
LFRREYLRIFDLAPRRGSNYHGSTDEQYVYMGCQYWFYHYDHYVHRGCQYCFYDFIIQCYE